VFNYRVKSIRTLRYPGFRNEVVIVKIKTDTTTGVIIQSVISRLLFHDDATHVSKHNKLSTHFWNHLSTCKHKYYTRIKFTLLLITKMLGRRDIDVLFVHIYTFFYFRNCLLRFNKTEGFVYYRLYRIIGKNEVIILNYITKDSL